MSTQVKLIAYRRVSTKGQGESGLGQEAQESAINAYVSMSQGELVASYTEVETGKKLSLTNRPQLAKALAHANRAKARLVIAKLDRLSRNVAFLSGLMESGVDFVACDNPNANRLTVHILAAVAEDEARRISTRTKDALAAYKARGGLMGSHRPECRDNLKQPAREAGAIVAGKMARELATKAYADLKDEVLEMRAAGMTQAAIAGALNDRGYKTRRDRPWNQVQVKRMLDRFRG
jgi:DNA invertase Pin-like site-specific DNA recombinase